ncbi:serine/threonine protein kinase, partial [Streptomyces fuscigenes]|nr:serine/threonine protein kinase [Streptomyces fuscigenes]
AAAGYDPAAATNVMPATGPDAQGGPQGPHPWQSQLQAARDRNEQTQVQPLDPSQDPLRHRPHRRQGPQQGQGQGGQAPYGGAPAPYAQQPQQQYRQPQQSQQQYRQPQQQQYRPQPPPQQYAAPPQQYAPPQQPAPRPPREPRAPRQRSANPMHIPGLGCLKGCLVVLVVLFVAGWLVWDLTPLQGWIADGKSYWSAIGDGISKVSGWISDLGGSGK